MNKQRRAAGLTRQRSLRVCQRDECRRARSQALKAEHPCWGYRRLWASLHAVEPPPIDKKRVLRLMREHRLLVRPNRQLQATRPPSRSPPKPPRPQEWGASTCPK